MGIQTGKRFRCRAELCTELGQFLTVGIAQTSGDALMCALGQCHFSASVAPTNLF